MVSADELVLKGREARAQEDRAGAAAFYEQACAAYELAGDAKRAMHSLRHAAELRLQVHEVEAAREEIGRVLRVYRDHGVGELELANTLRVAAMAEEAAGEKVAAREMWVEARVLYQDEGVEAGAFEAGRRMMALGG